MPLTKEEKNRDEINSFLQNNDIEPQNAMSFDNKFGTAYYVGESRKFAEETRIGFNIVGTSDVNVTLYEINDIEFETGFKVSEEEFSYNDSNETLTIIGNSAKKHNEEYKIVINSIYLDF